MKTKKDGKIVWQIAVMLYSLTAAVVLLSGGILYATTYRRYTEKLIYDRLDLLEHVEEEFESYRMLPWLMEYWEEHEDALDPPLGIQPYAAAMVEVGNILHISKTGDEFWEPVCDLTPDVARSLSPEEQKKLAEFMYSEWASFFVWMKQMEPRAEFYWLRFDPKDEKEAYIVFEGDAAGDIDTFAHEITLGGSYPYSEGEYELMKDLYDAADGEAYFEIFPAVDDGVPTGAIYLPVIRDGKLAYFLVTNSPMSEGVFRSLESIRSTFVTLLIALWAMCTVVIIFLKYRLIRPIARMQHDLREYVTDWDRERITECLSQDRQRNEMGQLSDDLVLLAEHMEAHIREVAALSAEKERIGTELSVAANIQRDVLPRTFPAFPEREEFDIYASMVPAKEVGGDFYDFFFADEEHLALAIGDVSGKGVPAALFMVTVKALIKNSIMAGERDPAKVLATVSDCMCDGNDECMFVTIWLAVCNVKTGELTCANAGHEKPVAARKGGAFAYIDDVHGLPVAAVENAAYTNYTVMLDAGDTLFVYTDGVSESVNETGEQFGDERLLDVLNEAPDASPEEIVSHMTERLSDFVGKGEPFDDITMLCLRFLRMQ